MTRTESSPKAERDRASNPPWGSRPTCFLVDESASFLKRALARRGFRVIAPGHGYSPGLPDYMAELIAEKEDCIIVTLDKDFAGNPRSIVIPGYWLARYNTWELSTK